ncbi:DUF6777 domain-containing protein [Streptomyces sp. NPDC056632]|uniref:DUF6777 domain-containing protein n=1 Tax=Streptomyces sp. NPDC056632 TaxID=3345884 RepID=UPI0036937253
MTSHPPSDRPSVPPTGPPSGPLSGPNTRPGQAAPPPPSGPPHDSSGGGGRGGGSGGGGSGGSGGRSGGGATGGGGGQGPWWRSVPKVASLTAVLVAAVALVVVLTQRDSGDGSNQAGSGGGEVFLQNASASGPAPFTRSTARTSGASVSPPALPSATGTDANATRSVSGSAPGLYGGTHRVASCDVEAQVRFLAEEPAKNAAFASVIGIRSAEVPGYLRSLTPVQLRVDTRVTNHGFRGGSPAPFQSVLQAGTAVLVDDHGVPRVRCACGNPLTPPVAQKAPKQVGAAWPGYRSSNVVVVKPSVTVINVFVIYDVHSDTWIARPSGDTGHHDKHTTPPPQPSKSPSTSPSSSSSSPSTSPSSPVPCVTVTGTQTPTPSNGVTPSPCPLPVTSTTTPPPSTSSSPVTPSSSAPSTVSSGPESPATDKTTVTESASESADQPANQSAGSTSSHPGLVGSPPAPGASGAQPQA